MESTANTIEILNDLIRINNDRIEGYQRAIKDVETEDVDLKAMFSNMAEQSMRYRQQLSEIVERLGGKTTDDTRIDGKIFRLWMDLKAMFTGNSRQSALESCERGEDAIQRAYTEALRSNSDLSAAVRPIVLEQQLGLQQSHDIIQKYRDLHSTPAA